MGRPEVGENALYRVPTGREVNHVHVWRNVLEEAGFTLDDLPKECQPHAPRGLQLSSQSW
jgi:hypothetical protein